MARLLAPSLPTLVEWMQLDPGLGWALCGIPRPTGVPRGWVPHIQLMHASEWNGERFTPTDHAHNLHLHAT